MHWLANVYLPGIAPHSLNQMARVNVPAN